MFLKSYRVEMLVRLMLVFLSMLLFSWLLMEGLMLALAILCALAIAWQIFALMRTTDQTNRDLTRFIEAIQHADFTQSFSRKYTNRSYSKLYDALADIMEKFKLMRTEKEEQYRYLQTVIQHLGTGILAFSNDGHVELLNKSAKKLLRVNHLRQIQSLNEKHAEFYQTLLQINRGEKRLVKLPQGENVSQITVHATDFIIAGKALKLVTMHDIQVELDEKEMEAWQNLIRVLTHEIMNSITPISSLASTASNLVPAKSGTAMSPENIEDVQQSLTTIRKRSETLLQFVEKYRSLTRIPRPQFQIVPLASLFDEIEHLYRDAFAAEKIKFESRVEPSMLELTADPEMVEQILINLVLNARQAVSGREGAKVELSGYLGEGGRVVLEVADNGPGIDNENIEKIFIPFFTTKKTGSGIGLSLCRQIMRMHGGSVNVYSQPDVRTVFRLRF